jgi:hypothetical protein
LSNEHERAFELALDTFGQESDLPGRFILADLTINDVARENSDVLVAVNEDAEFWAIASYALHESVFMALHRLFDTDSAGNVYALINHPDKHREIFSREALGLRKNDAVGNPFDWTRTAHEPSDDDFRMFRKEIGQRRAIYDDVYRPIRGKILAHRIYTGSEAAKRYALTRIDELQGLCAFFPALHRSLFGWYHNGVRPELAVRPTLLAEIRRGATAEGAFRAVVKQTERVMRSIIGDRGET